MYALINKSDGTLVKKSRELPTIDGSIPKDLDPSLEWLEVEVSEKPPYDKVTQKLERSGEKSGRKWIVSFNIVELTEDEKSEALERKQRNESIPKRSKINQLKQEISQLNDTPEKRVIDGIVSLFEKVATSQGFTIDESS